jgi:hypothetical protein
MNAPEYEPDFRCGTFDPKIRALITPEIRAKMDADRDRAIAAKPAPRPVSPFLLPWTEAQLDYASDAWGCNCGPCSIGAALGFDLVRVATAVPDFRGYMNPTQMSVALIRLNLALSVVKNLKTTKPCQGINRVQWVGSWLDDGVPPAAAYAHTHWIAHYENWVLCTATDPLHWHPFEEWERHLAETNRAWYFTHHYVFPGSPLRALPCPISHPGGPSLADLRAHAARPAVPAYPAP